MLRDLHTRSIYLHVYYSRPCTGTVLLVLLNSVLVSAAGLRVLTSACSGFYQLPTVDILFMLLNSSTCCHNRAQLPTAVIDAMMNPVIQYLQHGSVIKKL